MAKDQIAQALARAHRELSAEIRQTARQTRYYPIPDHVPPSSPARRFSPAEQLLDIIMRVGLRDVD